MYKYKIQLIDLEKKISKYKLDKEINFLYKIIMDIYRQNFSNLQRLKLFGLQLQIQK